MISQMEKTLSYLNKEYNYASKGDFKVCCLSDYNMKCNSNLLHLKSLSKTSKR